MATPPYVAPYIDPVAGLVIPSYASILSDLITQYRAIYPSVVYLGTDTAKYQELSMFALKIYDTCLAIQLAYNARSPKTAVGSDLDAVVALNGIARKAATYSTAPLTITGVATTVITNGQVTDQAGNAWALPPTVTIPSGGTVTVTATCNNQGAIQAAANTITQISGGATGGWYTATNPSAASPGLPVETDSQLRARQALSVAKPSLTTLAGTVAAIAAVPGVTRYFVEENPTGATDGNGCPPHSISAVVEGGDDTAIATAIYQNRGIGCYTNGTTSVDITDPNSGNITTIRFSRPTYVPVWVTMVLHGLTGYTTDVITQVQTALVTYLNSLQIGETLTFSSLYSIAQSVMPSLLTPQFSITSCLSGTSNPPTGDVDIPIAYNAVVQGVTGNVVVTEA